MVTSISDAIVTLEMPASTPVSKWIPVNMPTNIAIPPMIGTSPMCDLRPPGRSTSPTLRAMGRRANMKEVVTANATTIDGIRK